MRFIRPYGILWLSALQISILFAPQATAATQLPASGTSAPSVPKTTAAAIPSPFATLGRPVGVAATATALLVTQAQRKTVKAIDSAGNVTIFATLPTTETSIEPYIAVSSGMGGFPPGKVYVVVRQRIWQISANGSKAKVFKKIP